ncbi:anthranilate synthase family protein [Phytoactinopolyspora limicola]|uniref:anthranilate synthase family protein n=1 Tax=Phytoactinopolyspora limicola TaxID=2715536 RepID=UPI00140AE786|nr:anthranilate synthase family protein [Phytoactinopolyspora limicola]
MKSWPDEILERILGGNPPPFALVYRPDSPLGSAALEVFSGDAIRVSRLADLPLGGAQGPRLLALIPYRQITERGYACLDDGEPIRGIVIREHHNAPAEAILRHIPETPIHLHSDGFDVSDEAYAQIVREVVKDDIGNGEGSNFVLRRTFTANVPADAAATALTVFRRLMLSESGTYWTFVVHTGDRTFVGATPERHVTLTGGTAVMNPISGTLRHGTEGPGLQDLLSFLADRKETDELDMVVDEELKMMSRICDAAPSVTGPALKEMARLTHTEYIIQGCSALDAREILRETMFAPTVTGSPLENACRVIARREPSGRGYYSGAVALIGRDAAGRHTLDSSILIRTADIDDTGRLRIGIGSTLVRLSDPASEIAETHAKAAGLLSALTSPAPQTDEPVRRRGLAHSPQIRAALAGRNTTLSDFWLNPANVCDRRPLKQRRILILDAQDAFTAMLAQVLRAQGPEVAVHPCTRPGRLSGWDVVVGGPGPGDPRDSSDPRVRALRDTITYLLDAGRPLLAVCLSHQILASLLGLDIVRREIPNQGLQMEIDLFGRSEYAGFYNTFAARCDHDTIDARSGEAIYVSRDKESGDVHAMRGPGFASAQFHPESVLTRNGPAILSDLIVSLLNPTIRGGS